VKIGANSRVVQIARGRNISKIRGGPQQHNMVRLGLFLQAELDGVTDVCPIDTADDPYFYTFKVQCGSCREVNANWVNISRQVPPTSTDTDPANRLRRRSVSAEVEETPTLSGNARIVG